MAEQRESRVKLGPLHHVAIVVKDVDKAAEYYGSVFGLGPFTSGVWDLKGMGAFVRGKPANARVKAGFASLGPIELELLEVVEGEAPQSEFLREKGEGLHHLAFWVDDLDAVLTELAKEGIEPILQYSFPMELPADPSSDETGGTKSRLVNVKECYLNSDRIGGVVIQLMEVKELSSL